eukprot:767097-Hanusia_phi.AAC.3
MHTGAQFVFIPYSDTKVKDDGKGEEGGVVVVIKGAGGAGGGGGVGVGVGSRRWRRISRRRGGGSGGRVLLNSSVLSLSYQNESIRTHKNNFRWLAATGGFFSGLGIVYEMNDYTADGTIADYMGGKRGVAYSLTFELYGKPGDLANCFEQFNPDNSDLNRVLDQEEEEVVEVVEVVVVEEEEEEYLFSFPLLLLLYSTSPRHAHLYLTSQCSFTACILPSSAISPCLRLFLHHCADTSRQGGGASA